MTANTATPPSSLFGLRWDVGPLLWNVDRDVVHSHEFVVGTGSAKQGVNVPVVIAALIAMGAATLVVWRIRRHRARTGVGRTMFVVGALLMAIGSAGVGVYVWARNTTDSSQVARSIVWGGSSFGDQHRFPSRTMSASLEPVTFAEAAQSALLR